MIVSSPGDKLQCDMQYRNNLCALVVKLNKMMMESLLDVLAVKHVLLSIQLPLLSHHFRQSPSLASEQLLL